MSDEKHYQVIVLGAGVAGIGAAMRLEKENIKDYIVLEKSDAVGGVWRENTYPGCACDVPSLFYSYSFMPNPNWKRFYGKQPEVRSMPSIASPRKHHHPHQIISFSLSIFLSLIVGPLCFFVFLLFRDRLKKTC